MPSVKHPLPSSVPAPLGHYQAVLIRAGAGSVSGQFPIREGELIHRGKLGQTLGIEEGREAARIAALNVLGQLERAVPGGLDAIELEHLNGCIACVPGFDGLPQVLDAASETFVEHLGERGHHTRGLLPVTFLPGDAAVELLVTFRTRSSLST
jgi:enamine deaminase RidA (YjgF/YER057c/UK114 family)